MIPWCLKPIKYQKAQASTQSTTGVASDDVTKLSNTCQRGKLVLNKDSAPYNRMLGEKSLTGQSSFFFPSWRGRNGLTTSSQLSASHFKRYRGLDKCGAVFSVDRRSPSMLLYGTLSLFRTNFAGCCAVTAHLQAIVCWNVREFYK